MDCATLVVRLQEVISALDRRIRHPERASEAAIAEDAARLRARAVQHLDDLGATVPEPEPMRSDELSRR